MTDLNIIQARFGQRVRQLRTQQGLSQEAFAEKCGLDRTYISGIERGVRNPTLQVLATLANGLDVPLPVLLSLSEV